MTTPAQTMTELADEIEGDLHHRVLQVITEKKIGLIVAALRSAAVPQGVRTRKMLAEWISNLLR